MTIEGQMFTMLLLQVYAGWPPLSLKWYQNRTKYMSTVCPKSCNPFYIVNYYIKWITTSWTDSKT